MGFPAPGFFTGNPTWGEGLQALDDVVARARQQIGADGVSDETIASGEIVPTTGSVRLFGQGSAADTLTTLDPVNFEDGQLVELRIGDENQPITVSSAASPAAGEVELAGGLDLELNDLSQRLVLQLDGTTWLEWARFGREKVHVINDPGEAVYINSWGGTARYWKDQNGTAWIAGVLSRLDAPAGSSGTFTLPPGYRPPASGGFSTAYAHATLGGVTDSLWRVSVSSAGVVSATRLAGAASGLVLLDIPPLAFRAEQ